VRIGTCRPLERDTQRFIYRATCALVTIACGGDDGGDAPTLETYLSQVDAVLQESDQQFAELEAQGLTTEDVQNPADAVALWEQARDIISDSQPCASMPGGSRP
jgi:hypothetical protein